MISIWKSAGLAVLAAVLFSACGSSSTAPTAPVVSATLTPVPTPAPTPTPYVPPPKDQLHLYCQWEPNSPQTFRLVVKAVRDKILAEHPDWFTGSSEYPEWIIAKDHVKYLQAVIDGVNATPGYFAAESAQADPSTTIAVKQGNDFSEAYWMVASQSRLQNVVYNHTCRPSEF